MNEQSFKANDWLEPIFSPNPLEIKNDSNFIGSNSDKFLPSKLLVPGWTGDGLASKTAYSIKTTSETLWKYSLKLFSTFKNSNNNFKNLVFNEYCNYVNINDRKSSEYNSAIDFWPFLFSDPSKQKNEIRDFINIYCYRAVITYLYRIQFITSLSKALFIKPTENNLLNPSGFLTKIFVQGSSRELLCESLQANNYSWFRPGQENKDLIIKLSKELEEISIIEFLKVFSNLPGIENLPEFSHTLSHKTFGEFLNQLLIKFPDWVNGDKKPIKYLNSKFSGDFLCSITNSYWLAQKNHEGLDSTLIIPDFIGESAEEGTFLKICQELQFLTFLSNLSIKFKKDPTELICQTLKQKYTKGSDNVFGQMNLFSQKDTKGEISYDRIVVNFSKVPKKNPHHSLVNQINAQLPCLNKNGFLFLFSNQNLFVSSQNERVQDILQSFKFEAYFNLERLKGKGEITSYLYILRKRDSKEALTRKNNDQKESCFFFRWSGNLLSFYDFQNFNKELDFFLSNRSPFSNSIYHKEISSELSFEFLQDAILDGVLLHSSSTDTSKVAHPNFFKNLTAHCLTFDNFFKIESINPQENLGDNKNNLTLELLGKRVRQEDKFPFILIVNHTDQNNIRIEIIPSSSYTAKVDENGYACFQYFGLVPKKYNLSINLFREYFNSDLGFQITQLSLTGTTKLKSKIRSLLVPSFFLPENNTKLDLDDNFEFLKDDVTNLSNIHPEELIQNFSGLKNSLDDILTSSPLKLTEGLSTFKLNLEVVLSWIYGKAPVNSNFKYTNPIIKASLSKLKLHPLFPSNNEIHIEILVEKPELLHGNLTGLTLRQNDSDFLLELSSQKGVLLEIHSDQEILNFIQFLLNSAMGIPISKIVSCLRIPKIKDLSEALSEFDQINRCLTYLHNETKSLIANIFMKKITSGSKGIIH